jgi:DNA modification methylase
MATIESGSDNSVTVEKQADGVGWSMFQADCCEAIKAIPDDSIDLTIYSPPFAGLYIYSDAIADMGNSGSNEEFLEHYGHLAPELYRVTVPGRVCVVHCKDLPTYYNRDGKAGLWDLPGELIRVHEAAGWSYHSRVTIWKCPVIERERTNNNGLLHKTVLRDRSQCRQGMADYLLVFRKTPDGTLLSDKPIDEPDGLDHYIGDLDPREHAEHPSKFARKANTRQKASIRIWQRYAEPVWWDIDQTRVLNFKLARDGKDEMHICPLQLDVIERAIHLWSREGDTVLSPFAGIGSEGYCSILQGRRFVGVELKESYFDAACRHLRQAENEATQDQLF